MIDSIGVVNTYIGWKEATIKQWDDIDPSKKAIQNWNFSMKCQCLLNRLSEQAAVSVSWC